MTGTTRFFQRLRHRCCTNRGMTEGAYHKMEAATHPEEANRAKGSESRDSLTEFSLDADLLRLIEQYRVELKRLSVISMTEDRPHVVPAMLLSMLLNEIENMLSAFREGHNDGE